MWIFHEFPDLWSVENTSLQLFRTQCWNCSTYVVKALAFFVQSFHKLIKFSLMCNGVKIFFFSVKQGFCDYILFANHHVFCLRPFFSHPLVILRCSIPETEKAGIVGVSTVVTKFHNMKSNTKLILLSAANFIMPLLGHVLVSNFKSYEQHEIQHQPNTFSSSFTGKLHPNASRPCPHF